MHHRFFANVLDTWRAYWNERRKYNWIFSGVSVGHHSALSDAGFFRSPRAMSRARALKYLGEVVPRSSLIHMDDINHIITYKLL